MQRKAKVKKQVNKNVRPVKRALPPRSGRPGRMKTPRAMPGVAIQRAPEIVRNTGLQITVSHTEKIGVVNASILNTNHKFIINPRRQLSFPWLSRLAQAFDMYRVLKMSVSYKPTCPTTTRGELVMAFDYDPTDDNSFSPAADIAAMRGAVAGPLYAPSVLYFDPAATPQSTHKFFCAEGGVADRFNDIATLWYNASSDAILMGGSLYIGYTIQLIDAEPVSSPYGLTAGIKNDKNSEVTKDNLIGKLQDVVVNVAGQAIQQGLNSYLNDQGEPATEPSANTDVISVFGKDSATLAKQIDISQRKIYTMSGFTTTEIGIFPFEEDADKYVHIVKPDGCSDMLLNAPIYGTFVPEGNVGPVIGWEGSPNLTVVSSLTQFTGVFLTGVPVVTFGCIWFVLRLTAGLKAWYRFAITNGEWSTASRQSWQLICVPDVQQWVPKFY